MPSGISAMATDIEPMTFSVISADSAIIGVPQMVTVGAASGLTSTIIPGESTDTLIINLDQLLVTWGGVTAIGKFEIRSKDAPSIIIFQDQPAGNIILPCRGISRFLGDYGLQVLNNSTGGEYSITANYTVKEI